MKETLDKPKPNKEYFYEDTEIDYLTQHPEFKPTDSKTQWVPACDVDSMVFFAGEKINSLEEGETLLMPFNDRNHLNGVMLEKNDGKLFVTWLDSYENYYLKNRQDAFKRALGDILGGAEIEVVMLQIPVAQQVGENASCGPRTMDNLQRLALDDIPSETQDQTMIRQYHMDALGSKNFNKYQSFPSDKIIKIDGNNQSIINQKKEAKRGFIRDEELILEQRKKAEFKPIIDEPEFAPPQRSGSLDSGVTSKESSASSSPIEYTDSNSSSRTGSEASSPVNYIDDSFKVDSTQAVAVPIEIIPQAVVIERDKAISPIVVQAAEFISEQPDEKAQVIEEPKGIIGSLVAKLGGYISKIANYFNPNTTGVEVIEEQPYYNYAAIKEAQEAQYQEDLKAPTKNLAKLINDTASPQLKEALVNFVAVAPTLTSEERVAQWEVMKNTFKAINAKDGAVLDTMQSQGFDHRDVDSLATVNAYVEGYQAVKTARSQYEASTDRVTAPDIGISSKPVSVDKVVGGRY